MIVFGRQLTVEKLPLEAGGEMVRAGIGRNKGRWFFRVDLWRYGWRVTAPKADLKHKMKDASDA